MEKHVKAHRLELLTKKLKSLRDEQFNLSVWQSDCGTVACAIGWAATIPEFQELGLRMDHGCPVFPIREIDSDTGLPVCRMECWGISAARALLGLLCEYDTKALFSSRGWVSYTSHREDLRQFPWLESYRAHITKLFPPGCTYRNEEIEKYHHTLGGTIERLEWCRRFTLDGNNTKEESHV